MARLIFIPPASEGGSALDWQESVLSIQNDPPGSPSDGDRYIVGTTPTGAWVGHADAIAQWSDSVAAWVFLAPDNGFAVYVEDVQEIYLWDGSWNELPTTPLATTAPVNSTFEAAVIGVSGEAARADHKHDLGTPALPSFGGQTSNAGLGIVPAREDHRHGHGDLAGGPNNHQLASGATNGFMSSADKTKLDGIAAGATNTPLSNTDPVDPTFAAADPGTSTEAARQDHKHDLGTPGSPPDITQLVGSAGASATPAREDHTHAHGQIPAALLGTFLHNLASAAADGFMSSSDFNKLASIAFGATTDAYAAANAADWNGVAPTTIKDALDRIAAALGPIP